ncbi:MAG TPA: hypothetical protein VNZ22_06130, partial [Bacillota bacterium]|nr:hypothetical protein [Bacillota bacterium]
MKDHSAVGSTIQDLEGVEVGWMFNINTESLHLCLESGWQNKRCHLTPIAAPFAVTTFGGTPLLPLDRVGSREVCGNSP